MDLKRLANQSIGASLCLFCLLVPLTMAGANIGWGVVLAAMAAYAALGGNLDLKAAWTPQSKLLWAYFGVCALTAALGINPRHSFRFLNQDLHKIWLFSIFSIAFSVDSAPQGVYGMALAFAAAAAIGIGQEVWYFKHGFASWMRAHAFVHPVVFGEQIAVALIGTFCFLIRPEPPLSGRRQRRLAGLLLFLFAAALFMNNTRAATAACAAGICAVCSVLPRARKWAPWALAASICLLALDVWVAEKVLGRDTLASQLASALRGGGIPAAGPLMRIVLWKAAWRMGLDHFWTGVGLNNFRAAFPNYYSVTFQDGSRTWGTADNLYLHQFAERGILGLAALLALFGSFWSRALKRARDNPDAFNLWAFGSWTAFLIMNMTEVAFQTEIVWMLLIFVWVWAEAKHIGAARRLVG